MLHRNLLGMATRLLAVVLCLCYTTSHAAGGLTASFIGGSGSEGWFYSGANDVAVAADGTVYALGMTASTDFPVTPGAYVCTSRGGQDFFVVRFSSDLSELLASTVIGGNANEIFPSLSLAADGTVYVSGATTSPDFPTTAGAFDRTISGYNDVFVARFDSDLTILLAATYLGGNGDDSFTVLDLDGDGHVVLGGISGSQSTNTFPTTAGAYDRTASSSYPDFFVSRLSADLTQLLASTFLGGQYGENWPGVVVDDNGDIIVAGATESADYPSTPGAYCESFHGTPQPGQYVHDVVVSKLSGDLTTLLASTFIGTEGFEGGGGVCLSPDGNVFVAGHVDGVGYPVTPGAYDEGFNGVNEYFVTKVSNDLSSVLASTYFTPDDVGFVFATAMTCDAQGNLLMTGSSWDQWAPTTEYAYDRSFNGGENDLYVRVMTGDLTTMTYASYLGGGGDEGDGSVAVGSDGDMYLVGYTSSTDFPVTSDGYDDEYNGGAQDAVLVSLSTDRFTRVSDDITVICWVDYDDDGYLDLFVVNTFWPDGEADDLYHNNGDGSYTKVEGVTMAQVLELGYGANWGDYDNDGDLDMVVANFRDNPSVLYVNNGGGMFAVSTGAPLNEGAVGAVTPSWIDYDLDGDLDLHIANSTGPAAQNYWAHVNWLFRNDEGTLNRVTSGIMTTHSRHTYGVAWSDYDNDGDPDVVMTNNVFEPIDLFSNGGDGNFSLQSTNVLGWDTANGGGCAWGDYDNDGDQDLFIASYSPGPSLLYQNNGDASFTKIAGHGLGEINGRAYSGTWGDYDNDGDLDIFVWLGDWQVVSNSRGHLYENLGDGTFERVPETQFVCDSCTVTSGVWGDHDRDGDLDLYLARLDPAWLSRPAYSHNMLLRNNGNSNHWIIVKLRGSVSNRLGVGTKVRVKAVIDGVPVWQLREMMTMTGSRAQPPFELHLGLGDAIVIDSLKLEWPSGIVQVLEYVPADQFLTVYEQCCEGRVGDANGSGEDEPTISDVSVLIDAKFISGSCEGVLGCLTEADINQSGGLAPDCGDITISDISVLIDYLFITGSSLGLPECL